MSFIEGARRQRNSRARIISRDSCCACAGSATYRGGSSQTRSHQGAKNIVDEILHDLAGRERSADRLRRFAADVHDLATKRIDC
jgi:hypothetical protein